MSDTDSEKSAPHTEEEEEKEARKDDGSIDFRSKRSTSVPHIIISDNLSTGMTKVISSFAVFFISISLSSFFPPSLLSFPTASSEGSSSNLKMRRRYSSARFLSYRFFFYMLPIRIYFSLRNDILLMIQANINFFL